VAAELMPFSGMSATDVVANTVLQQRGIVGQFGHHFNHLNPAFA
jgi:hypothetical protein